MTESDSPHDIQPSADSVWQNHRFQITELGPHLIPLARSENCLIEAWVHPTKPLYGVQFHPEVYDTEHADGRTVLSNCFTIARAYIKGS